MSAAVWIRMDCVGVPGLTFWQGWLIAKWVLRAGSPIIIIDNAGGDELHHIQNGLWLMMAASIWSEVASARLLGFYLGVETGHSITKTHISFNIAAYVKHI